MKRDERWINKIMDAAEELREFTKETGQRLELISIPMQEGRAAIRVMIGDDGLRYDIFGEGTKTLSRQTGTVDPATVKFVRKNEEPMLREA